VDSGKWGSPAMSASVCDLSLRKALNRPPLPLRDARTLAPGDSGACQLRTSGKSQSRLGDASLGMPEAGAACQQCTGILRPSMVGTSPNSSTAVSPAVPTWL
jgi:hypothetical protein